jgi:ATP-binding cassette subfamily B protein
LYRDRFTNIIQQLPDYIEFIGKSNSVINKFNNYPEQYKNTINVKYKKFNLNFDNIVFKNIYFNYNNSTNSTNIFNNLNLSINLQNKIIGLTGKSGSGKSSLAKLIIKSYKFDGNIYIDNININEIDCEYIRKNILYVDQNAKLFDRKIIDNLIYACDDKELCKIKINELFKYKNINKLYKNLNIENKAGLNGEKLSGGQKQVINIINSLILSHPILILDEPTNALDIELKKEIIDLIKYYKQYKKCIIIISHDKDIMKIFDENIQI